MAAGPRGRGAWRGATRGFLVGAGISVLTVAILALRDPDRVRREYICEWPFASFMALPFTASTTAAGAIVGAVAARPGQVPPLSAVPAETELTRP